MHRHGGAHRTTRICDFKIRNRLKVKRSAAVTGYSTLPVIADTHRSMASVSLTGKAVIVSGLKSRPELNFLCGVAEKLDDTSGRFAVRLPVLSKPILLKPDNLEAAPDAVAAIAACCEAEHAAEVKELRGEVAGHGRRGQGDEIG